MTPEERSATWIYIKGAAAFDALEAVLQQGVDEAHQRGETDEEAALQSVLQAVQQAHGYADQITRPFLPAGLLSGTRSGGGK